ncbi:MAG: FecCD family ABC transporter permease [Sporolactobacillus sp.]
MSEKNYSVYLTSAKGSHALFLLIIGLFALLFFITFSLTIGAVPLHLQTVWQSIFHGTNAASDQIVRNIRLPRAIAAALIGAFLAISGALMQGMTRNPLASPSIMGVTAGASFVMALILVILPQASETFLMFGSFAGAGIGVCLVLGVAFLSKNGLSPVKLVLAGTAISALLNSFSAAIALHFNIAKDLSFWYAGGLSGVQWMHIRLLLPVAAAGFILALLLSRSITALSLGEEVAKGLGARTGIIKLGGVLTVLLLTGAAVSVAGTIGFIGLIIPHLTRFLIGNDYRWVIPCSAVLGANLLVISDLAARMINPPFETPVGVITALIGVPFFLHLARREGGGRL